MCEQKYPSKGCKKKRKEFHNLCLLQISQANLSCFARAKKSEIKKKIEKSLKRSALSIKKAKPKPAAAAAAEEEAEAEAAHKINNFV